MKEPKKTIIYFSGSVAIEDYLPEIKNDPQAGVLFTFFDIPKKRFKNIKREARRKEKRSKK